MSLIVNIYRQNVTRTRYKMTEKQLSLLIHGAGESGYVVQEVYLSLEDFDELRGDTGCARNAYKIL